MAISEDSVASRARVLLSSRGDKDVPLFRLLAVIPNAKRKLALVVAADFRRRNALRKEFALTVSSGTVDLTGVTFLGASEPLLLDCLRHADIFSAGSTYRWQWVGGRSVLALQVTTGGFIHYTVDGPVLYTNAPDASATMRASYEPSLATIEAQGLDDELVELVAGMVVAAEQAEAAA